jgi:hypothetical protein
VRVRVRMAIAKGGRAADVFLPDRLVSKLRRFWKWKRERREDLVPAAPLFANQSRRRISKRRVQSAWAGWQRRAGLDRTYGFHALRAHGGHERVPDLEGPIPGSKVCEACESTDDDGVHASKRRRARCAIAMA